MKRVAVALAALVALGAAGVNAVTTAVDGLAIAGGKRTGDGDPRATAYLYGLRAQFERAVPAGSAGVYVHGDDILIDQRLKEYAAMSRIRLVPQDRARILVEVVPDPTRPFGQRFEVKRKG